MHQRFLPVAFSLSLLLAACGGGGSSSSSTARAIPQPPTAAVAYLGLDLPPSTYKADGKNAELGGWTVLQEARIACGFGALTQNPQLDAAARLHSQYQTSQSMASGQSLLTHYETVTSDPFYTGYNPWDRTRYQGYGSQVAEILEATTWDYDTTNLPSIPTMEQRGAASMRDLLNTVYHLVGAMYAGADVGFGADLQNQTSGTAVHEEYRFGSLNGYQTRTLAIHYANDPVTPELATYPCTDSSTVPSRFKPAYESPNPFEGTALANQTVGPPIYVKVDAGQILTLTSASITGPDTASVPYTPMTHRLNDPASELLPNEYFIVPNTPLQANSNYAVTLNGTISQTNRFGVVVSSKNFTRSFTLKTGD